MSIPRNRGGGAAWVIILIIIILIIVWLVGRGGSDDVTPPTGGDEVASAYKVTVRNTSDTQVLSPGVFMVHTADASMGLEGELAHASLEPLAEYGSNAAFAEFVGTLPGVIAVYRIDAPIMPGGETSFMTEVLEMGDVHLSGILMAVGSNDGIAVVKDLELALSGTHSAVNYDAGFEENSALLSGFDGGQPDPSRGEENVENGTPTTPQAVVVVHPQLTDTIMEVMVEQAS